MSVASLSMEELHAWDAKVRKRLAYLNRVARANPEAEALQQHLTSIREQRKQLGTRQHRVASGTVREALGRISTAVADASVALSAQQQAAADIVEQPPELEMQPESPEPQEASQTADVSEVRSDNMEEEAAQGGWGG